MLTDESLMPFGKHKDTKMANVPANYLLWFLAQDHKILTNDIKKVLKYCEENIDVLKKQV